MAIKVMADNNLDITAAQDGALYNALSGGQDFVFRGIGSEMVLNRNSSSLQVSVGTGEAIICGRHVTITAPATLNLSTYTTYYIALRVNLAQSAGNEGSVVALTSQSQLKTENLNNNGNIHDLLLYQVDTSYYGVQNSYDRRVIKSNILDGFTSDVYSKQEADSKFMTKTSAGTQVTMNLVGTTLNIRSK